MSLLRFGALLRGLPKGRSLLDGRTCALKSMSTGKGKGDALREDAGPFGLLHPTLRKALPESFTEATGIQQSVIPTLLRRQNLLATAETGEGKTAAYGLPLLHDLLSRPAEATRSPRALVVLPSSVLARQVYEVLREELGGNKAGMRIALLSADEELDVQRHRLERSGRAADVLVATPGRLARHLVLAEEDTRGTLVEPYLTLEGLRWWVLDEGDRLLSLGLLPDLLDIWRFIPKGRSEGGGAEEKLTVAVVTATLPSSLRTFVGRIAPQHSVQDLNAAQRVPGTVTQIMYSVSGGRKLALLEYLLRRKGKVSLRGAPTLVFLRTIRRVERYAEALQERGWAVSALHAELSPTQRMEAVRDLREGKVQLILATDIAARGVDLPELEAVVNLDMPYTHAEYVHRVGRVGRAGKAGVAISLVSKEPEVVELSDYRRVTRDEEMYAQRIEAGVEASGGKRVERRKVPGPWRDESRSGVDPADWVERHDRAVAQEQEQEQMNRRGSRDGRRGDAMREGRREREGRAGGGTRAVRKIDLPWARREEGHRAERVAPAPPSYEQAVEDFTAQAALDRGVRRGSARLFD